MHLRAFAFALVSALVATAAACETRISLGTPCRNNTDCGNGLLCSFGRCRTSCARQSDCGGAQVCIQELGQSAVCTLVDDTCAGTNECSAGLVCNVSVCAAPCTTTSCVEGSSCRTDPTSMRDVCVRDDLADAGSDAFVSADARDNVDAGPRCLRDGLAAPSTRSLAALFGSTTTRTIASFEVTDDEPFAPLPVLAVGIAGRHAWIVGNRDVRSGAIILEGDFPATGDAVSFSSLSGWNFAALDDVSAVDVRRGPNGLSALLVRRDPFITKPGLGTTEVVMWHVRDTQRDVPRSVVEQSADSALFPGGAALFGGLMRDARGDDSAIAFVVQPEPPAANALFLIDGDATMESYVGLDLPSGWPAPVPLRGATGALAALHTGTGEVRFARVDGSSRALPNALGLGEAREAIAMDLTDAVGSRDAFLMATISSACLSISVARIACVGGACRVATSVRIPTAAQPIDVRLATLAGGYAVVTTHVDGATMHWLDVDLARRPSELLFPRVIADDYTFDGLALDADERSLFAVARYRSGMLQRYYGHVYFGE